MRQGGEERKQIIKQERQQSQSRNVQSNGDKGRLCQMTKRELDESGGELESEGRVGVDDGTIE